MAQVDELRCGGFCWWQGFLLPLTAFQPGNWILQLLQQLAPLNYRLNAHVSRRKAYSSYSS